MWVDKRAKQSRFCLFSEKVYKQLELGFLGVRTNTPQNQSNNLLPVLPAHLTIDLQPPSYTRKSNLV